MTYDVAEFRHVIDTLERRRRAAPLDGERDGVARRAPRDVRDRSAVATHAVQGPHRSAGAYEPDHSRRRAATSRLGRLLLAAAGRGRARLPRHRAGDARSTAPRGSGTSLGYVTKALHEKLEFDDAEHPQLWMLQTPTHKSFGDNPDCTYHVARIDGVNTYRIVGNRGTVKWVSFVVSPAAPEQRRPRGRVGRQFRGLARPRGMPEELDPYAARRDAGDGPPVLRRLGHRGADADAHRAGRQLDAPPQPLTPDRAHRRTRRDAIGWLVEDTNRWADWIDFYRDHPNEFVTGMPEWTGDGAQSGARAAAPLLLLAGGTRRGARHPGDATARAPIGTSNSATTG